MNQIKAWSYSRWTTYQQCPAKAKYQIIDRLPMQQNEAMERGSRLHELADKYLRGALKTVPAELKNIAPELRALKKVRALSELEWCFNDKWEPVDWMAKDAWLRVKLDVFSKVGALVRMLDWKTGKRRDGYQTQLELYALAGFVAVPEAQEISTELHYMDDTLPPVKQTFLRNELPGLKKKWLKDTRAMLNDKSFAPTPNNLCRWCDFARAKGGPCQF